MLGRMEVTGVAALPILGKIFLAIALALLLGAGSLALVEQFAGHDAIADGVVVEAGQRPRVRFVAANGDAVIFQPRMYAEFHETGEHLPVAYSPTSPHSAVLNAGRWLFPTTLGIIGGAFLCIGAGLGFAGWLFAPR